MKTPPVIAEIVGPSGAGKSTLSAAINSVDCEIEAGLTVWGLPLISLAWSTLLSAPDLLGLIWERKQFRQDELKQVIRIGAFYRILMRKGVEAGSDHKAFLLDEGVVFALAKLRADIDSEFRSKRMRRWEEKALDRWSSILSTIIWMDAPDEVLIWRINNRAKQHRMKNSAEDSMREFLARYRAAYVEVIDKLKSRGKIQVIQFRTDELDPRAMVGEILAYCSVVGVSPKSPSALL
jgi:shikimate kinase